MNAIEHIWGHFKNTASSIEKARFQQLKVQFAEGEISFNRIRNWLQRLAVKYEEPYLLQSLFFVYD